MEVSVLHIDLGPVHTPYLIIGRGDRLRCARCAVVGERPGQKSPFVGLSEFMAATRN